MLFRFQIETIDGPVYLVRLARPLAPGDTHITHFILDHARYTVILFVNKYVFLVLTFTMFPYSFVFKIERETHYRLYKRTF